MGVPSMDDRAFIMAVFSSSSIDDSQVVRIGAVVHIECSVIGDCYGEVVGTNDRMKDKEADILLVTNCPETQGKLTRTLNTR